MTTQHWECHGAPPQISGYRRRPQPRILTLHGEAVLAALAVALAMFAMMMLLLA